MLQEENEWLRFQVAELQQKVLEQAKEQHELEQELQRAAQDLMLLHQQHQKGEVYLLSFEKLKELAEPSLTKGKLTRETLTGRNDSSRRNNHRA